eukprot:1141950-Pelagomonas_calceolata.AAC.2
MAPLVEASFCAHVAQNGRGGMGSIGSPTTSQKECVGSDLGNLELFAQFTVLMPGVNMACSIERQRGVQTSRLAECSRSCGVERAWGAGGE